MAGNIITLCGDGAKGCHGARHGSPYSVRRQPVPAFPIEWERRDAEWVARRIGERLAEYRPDVIVYLVDKLDETAAFDFLRRNYPPDPEFPWKPEKLS